MLRLWFNDTLPGDEDTAADLKSSNSSSSAVAKTFTDDVSVTLPGPDMAVDETPESGIQWPNCDASCRCVERCDKLVV